MAGNGEIIKREVSGLCKRQHHRMNKLIRMAQKAGLFGSKDVYAAEKTDYKDKPWAQFKTYWDDTTPDKQWMEGQRKQKIFAFRK